MSTVADNVKAWFTDGKGNRIGVDPSSDNFFIHESDLGLTVPFSDLPYVPLNSNVTSGKTPAIPHLEQYFGLWAVEPDRFRAMAEHVRAMDIQAHVAEGQALAESRPIPLEGGIEAEWDPKRGFLTVGGDVALIDLSGTLTKHGSSLSSGGSMVLARRKLSQAARDSSIGSIVLRIDSPGGTVSGTADLANDIAAINKTKPVTVFAEDLMASAALWVGSRAGRVFANDGAQVGSIGVFMAVQDWSAIYAKEGLKVHVIKAGQFKGAGVAGTKITDAQLAEWQRMVDETAAQFVAAIVRGRRMSLADAQALADGRVWSASDAQAKGLIDGISTLAEAINFTRHEKTNRLFRAESQGRQANMNFMDALKAVLAGKPEAAHEDHRQIAIDAVAAVRDHDKTASESALATARAEGKAEGLAEGEKKAMQATTDAANNRAAEIIDLGGKLHLTAEQVAGHVKGGKDIGTIAKEGIEQSSKAQGGITARRDHNASQPGTEDEKAASDALKKASEDVAAGLK